jgi:hypothetical protein
MEASVCPRGSAPWPAVEGLYSFGFWVGQMPQLTALMREERRAKDITKLIAHISPSPLLYQRDAPSASGQVPPLLSGCVSTSSEAELPESHRDVRSISACVKSCECSGSEARAAEV